ncbi:MAG: hypothetical protein INR71_10070, partial [Terriglobus roseus]|nr:hypothetical protein [Terriglobus roseus]
MGAADRRPPPLPAPTETSSVAIDDLATDVSRQTDLTSQTIPEDGRPITISTSKRGASSRGDKSNQSQTSLLIEYFEGHRSDKVQSRPSVRVRVTPSRGKAKEGDHIQITETGKSRKPSYTRRISLGKKEEVTAPAGASELSYSTGGSHLTGPPVEVEVLHNASELSRSDVGTGYPYPSLVQGSDVSSMPPDSTLEGDLKFISPPRSPLIEEATLRAPPERERSISREREITHRVMEKIAQREGKPSSRRTSSREYVIESTSGKRSSTERSRTEDAPTSLNPSDLSRRSERSTRSGTSNISINNPKLLQTVEDAIKRLILPELNAVKEEQRLQRNYSKFDKRSADSPKSPRSEEGLGRRMSKSSSAPDVKGARPRVIVTKDSDEKVRRERRSSKGSDRSERSRQVSSETVKVRRSKSRDKSSHLKDAALIAGADALTAAALKHHDSMSSIDSRHSGERRRKRRSKSRSRTASISEEPEVLDVPPLPVMPSEIGTDLTRESILSARTDTRDSPRSTPSRELNIMHVSRGSPREVHSPTTPTRTANLQRSLGSYHNNVSGPDITSREVHHEHFHGGLAPAAAAAATAMGGAAVLSSLQDISGL